MTTYTRLMYASSTSALPSLIKKHLIHVLTDANPSIQHEEMTGVLICGNDYIFHCLEVPTKYIQQVQQAVAKNSYSHAFKQLKCEAIRQRCFHRWEAIYFMQYNEIEKFFINHDWEKFNPYALQDDLLQQFMTLLAPSPQKSDCTDFEEVQLLSYSTEQTIYYHYIAITLLAMIAILMFYWLMHHFGFLPMSAYVVH